MRYRNLFLIYGLILIFCISQAVRGEDHVPDGGELKPSPVIPEFLDPEILELLQKYVTPSTKYLTSRFQELGKGLRESMWPVKGETAEETKVRNDEKIAKDIAELFGQISTEQALRIMNELGEETLKSTHSSRCDDKEKEKFKLIDAMKERMYWAARFVLDDVKEDRGVACIKRQDSFNEVFSKHWEATKKHNEEFHNQLKLAKGGNTEAIKKIKEKYDSSAILGFLETQNENGNSDLSTDLAKVLSEKNDKDHFIDATSSDGTKHRILLGAEPGDFSKRLREIKADPKQRGIAKLSYSATPHEGTPNLIFPNSRGDIVLENAEPKTTPKPNVAESGTRAPDSTTENFKTPADVQGVFVSKCVSCHKPGESGFDSLPMTETGEFAVDSDLKGLAKGNKEILEKVQMIYDAAILKSTSVMPPSKKAQMTELETKTLKDWLILQGAKNQ